MTSIEIHWNNPPSFRELNDFEAHVWAASLDVPDNRRESLQAELSTEELQRGCRFKFERDQKRFAVGRGLLRTILGAYTGMAPASLQFGYAAKGKPFLASNAGLNFNLAHSDDLFLLAICKSGPVGVDVERIRVMDNMNHLVESFFSGAEFLEWQSVPESEKPRAFFNLWTRKEACLKATGDGIAEGLKDMIVTFLPGQSARVLKSYDCSYSAAEWTLQEINPGRGYAAAVAAPIQDLRISCWHWRD